MISFSGIDCGGKSTQIEMISEYMNSTSKYRKQGENYPLARWIYPRT